MIIGFHLTWTTYGHWFPNDPRGSWSDEVWKPELLDLRNLDDERKVTRPRPVDPNELQEFLDAARKSTKWGAIWLSEPEIEVVGNAFAEAIEAIDLEVHACAIMTNHVHLVTRRHTDSYERIIDRLKGRGSQFVRQARGIPVATRRAQRVPIWTKRFWVRYINRPEQMCKAMDYVRQNRDQNWGFLKEFAP